MSKQISNDEYLDALYVLEILRDSIETTSDETQAVNEAHNIIQEYYNEGEL